MAENLKPKDDEVERQDKLERIDPKLKYIKDLIEDALKYAKLEDEADRQKVIYLHYPSTNNFHFRDQNFISNQLKYLSIIED